VAEGTLEEVDSNLPVVDTGGPQGVGPCLLGSVKVLLQVVLGGTFLLLHKVPCQGRGFVQGKVTFLDMGRVQENLQAGVQPLDRLLAVAEVQAVVPGGSNSQEFPWLVPCHSRS